MLHQPRTPKQAKSGVVHNFDQDSHNIQNSRARSVFRYTSTYSKMSRGGGSSDNYMPLQVQEKCKICMYKGKDLVKHYVEDHTGVEIPINLTSKELVLLKNNAKTTTVVNETNHEDKENILLEYLKSIGPEATFSAPAECPLCPYNTTSRSEMMNHLLIHQSASFLCYFCSTTESNLIDFRDHVATHTGEYAYQCLHCSYRGAHSSDVARHILSAHPGKEAKTIFENVAQSDEDTLNGYACSHCGFIQMSKTTMEKHVASVDTFCRGSSVIEFDLSRNRSTPRSSVVKRSTSSGKSSGYVTNSQSGQNRLYIQDEIEIEPNEPPTADSILPFNEEQNREGWNPLLKIKTEKIDHGYNKHTSNTQGANAPSNINVVARSNSPAITQPARTMTPSPVVSSNKEQPPSQPPNEPRSFVCASCQFSTKDETEFIKHARTDHRTDLSLWCKSCGKCFSNAGVLVTHIKEGTCEKEEMIYRCGVKECTFETPSGQTFVHHLRHCHKGSPFIFCVHCQKIFTLPHCLILHMQNDCPYKEKNRKHPGQTSSNTQAPTSTNNNAGIVAPKPAAPAAPIVTQMRPVLPRPTPPAPTVMSMVGSSRGRGELRGRAPRGGRGKARSRPSRFVDSDSESDPDDPSWKPEEVPSSRPVRRSARFRRSDEDTVTETQVSLPKADQAFLEARKEELFSNTVTCPSCDFSTLSKTILEDHYISEHKKPDKSQCKVCSVKFETIPSFIEHFESMHRKTIVLPEKSLSARNAVPVSPDASSTPTPSAPVLMEMDASRVAQPTDESTIIKIPYQTAIHEKNQKDAKLKNFEELKAPNDIVKMKEDLKLKHFFKCMLWNCTFTTDNSSFFVSHLSDNHSGKKLYCSFCFMEFSSAAPLTNHMLLAHRKRCYQCSACFYRAFSKPHVQIHIKYNHSKETAVVYTSTTHLSNDIPPEEENEEESIMTTWPYHCAIGECKFKTFDPKDFKKHNEITHRAVSVFICYYCKAEFISFKRLMNHYRLHGINNYQCTYCLHGSDTKEEILAHLSQNHADKPFQVHVRASQDPKALEGDVVKPGIADSNNNQNSSQLENLDRSQKKYGKSVKADASNEVPLVPPVPVEKIKKEDEKVKKPTEKFTYEKVYPHHISDFESKFSCGISTCDKQFEKMDLYLKHLQHNHIAINIVCPYCLDVTESEFDFKNHLWHHGPNLFACGNESCRYNHWKKEEVIQHVKVEHEKNDTVITIRQKEMNSSFVMKLPEILCSEDKKDLDNLQEGFLCPFCYYKSKSRVTMKKHIYREFEYMRFRCSFCDTKFCSQKDIRLHFLSEHSNEDIKATLDLNAEIEYKVKAFLFCHQNAMSTNSSTAEERSTKADAVVVCTDCNKKFPRARDWHEHLKFCVIQQYDVKVLEFVKCLVCDTKFTELNLLKIHFSSAHCGKQLCFVEKPNRMEWMREMLLCLRLRYVEHTIDGLIKLCKGSLLSEVLKWKTQCKLESKIYKCFYCPFSNPFKFNVEGHLASSHSGKPIKIDRLTSRLFSVADSKIKANDKGEKEATSYCCGICQVHFHSLNNLKRHVVAKHSQAYGIDWYYVYASSGDAALMEDKETSYECVQCNSGAELFPEIKAHYEKSHPTSQLRIKAYFDESTKRKLNEDDSSSSGASSGDSCPPSKKTKLSDDRTHCFHCQKSFQSLEELSAHCYIIHPFLPVKYEKQPNSEQSKAGSPVCISLSALGKDINTSEASTSTGRGSKISTNNFICNQCGSVFQSVYQVEQHRVSQHRKVAGNSTRNPEIYNLEKISLCVEHKETGSMRLSALYFARTFNILPCVELTDIHKK